VRFGCRETSSNDFGFSSNMRCCVPRCKTKADCPAGETCGTAGTCRKPTCHDLGGVCRDGDRFSQQPNAACLNGEAEQPFTNRCDSGCGYHFGPCGQTCCLPAELARTQQLAASVEQLQQSGTAERSGGGSTMLHLTEVVILGAIAACVFALYRGTFPSMTGARDFRDGGGHCERSGVRVQGAVD